MSNLFFYISAKQHNLQCITGHFANFLDLCSPFPDTMTPHAHLCFHLFGNTVQEHVHDFDNGDGVYDDMERVIEWAERWQIKFNNMK